MPNAFGRQRGWEVARFSENSAHISLHFSRLLACFALQHVGDAKYRREYFFSQDEPIDWPVTDLIFLCFGGSLQLKEEVLFKRR